MKYRKWITGNSGWDILTELMSDKTGKKIIAAYPILLALVLMLSFFCHWRIFLGLYNIITSYLFTIVFCCILLCWLELPFGNYKDQEYEEVPPTGAKLWSLFLIAAMLFGHVVLHRHSQQYRFECGTYYVVPAKDTYHIYSDCEELRDDYRNNELVIKLRGYEIKDQGLVLCDCCYQIAEDREEAAREIGLRPH